MELLGGMTQHPSHKAETKKLETPSLSAPRNSGQNSVLSLKANHTKVSGCIENEIAGEFLY